VRGFPATAAVRTAPTAAAATPATPATATAVPATAATVLSPTTATAQSHGRRVGEAPGRRWGRTSEVPRRRRPGVGDIVGQREPDQVPGTGPVSNHQQDVREQQASHVVADGVAGSAAATTATAATAAATVPRRLVAATAPATASPAPAETGRPALGIRIQTTENYVDHDGCPCTPDTVVPQVFLTYAAARLSDHHNIILIIILYFHFTLNII